MTPPIKVFIVDDSALVRSILAEKLDAIEGISVVGNAMDPIIARDKMANLDIDVLLLDIETPRMDGLAFLEHLMKSRPIPTIILSSLMEGMNDASMKALELGAINVMGKPGGPFDITQLIEDLADEIRAVAAVDMDRVKKEALGHSEKAGGVRKNPGAAKTTKKLIAVGASTGGTIALERIFRGFLPDSPPAAAVIHMPGKFTATFANRLNDLCPVRVKEAEDGESAIGGHVYIAPGDYHLLVQVSGTGYMLKLVKGPRVQNQRPAVDVLFHSVAEYVGGNAIGVILTGMGRDGAEGLLKMREAGAYTIAQDEESCVVYGMPKEAVRLGAATIELPLDKISEEIMRQVH